MNWNGNEWKTLKLEQYSGLTDTWEVRQQIFLQSDIMELFLDTMEING